MSSTFDVGQYIAPVFDNPLFEMPRRKTEQIQPDVFSLITSCPQNTSELHVHEAVQATEESVRRQCTQRDTLHEVHDFR